MGEKDKSPLMTKGRMKTADKNSPETSVCEGTSTKGWQELFVGWCLLLMGLGWLAGQAHLVLPKAPRIALPMRVWGKVTELTVYCFHLWILMLKAKLKFQWIWELGINLTRQFVTNSLPSSKTFTRIIRSPRLLQVCRGKTWTCSFCSVSSTLIQISVI